MFNLINFKILASIYFYPILFLGTFILSKPVDLKDTKPNELAKGATLGTNCYDTCLLQPGEALLTCGSGQAENSSVLTHQNLDDYVLAIFDITDPVGDGATQASNWTGPLTRGVYHDSSWKAQELGELFGLTIKPNAANGCQDFYVTQWGLTPGRTHTDSLWYQGDLATSCEGGAVFKVDGSTGAVSLFTCLPSHTGNLPGLTFDYSPGYNPYIGTVPTYTGLGQITYNKDCDVFYVSNFEDGLIYTLDNSGNIIGTFDFGVAGLPAVLTNDGSLPGHFPSVVDGSNQIPDDPAEHLSPWARRVFGLGYNYHENKLYFSTLSKRNPTTVSPLDTDQVDQFIFSVDIDMSSCGILSSTSTLQATIDQGNRSPVSDITFSLDNKMLISQMTMKTVATKSAHSADLVEFLGGNGAWTIGNIWRTSTFNSQGGAAGGVDYGYNNYGSNPDAAGGNNPEDAVVSTVDAAIGIHNPKIYGIALNKPGDGSGSVITIDSSYVVDADGLLTVRNKFVFGDIEVLAPGCNLTTLNMVCIGSVGNNYTFSIFPDETNELTCDYNISSSNGTPDMATGSVLKRDTFVINNVTDFNTLTITVDIPACDGSVPCSLTESIVLPPLFTATAVQVSCTSNVSNEDAQLEITTVQNDATHYNFSAGTTYTGPTTYTSGTAFDPITDLPLQFGTFANPTGTQAYTIRVFDNSDDCYKDETVVLSEMDCCLKPVCLPISFTKK